MADVGLPNLLDPLEEVERGHGNLLISNEDERICSKHHSHSIFRVPGVYRDISPSSFTPRVVSIGPLHHNDPHLKKFEKQKETYVHDLFHNLLSVYFLQPIEHIMDECVNKVHSSIGRIKKCYVATTFEGFTDSYLAKMMVRDACFILVFLHNFVSKRDVELGENVILFTHVLIDMFLIENQIPFFVLEQIFECTSFHRLTTLTRLILSIKRYCHIFEDLEREANIPSNGHPHILGFLHNSYQKPIDTSVNIGKMVKTHSVVELDRSGISFSKNSDAEWPMAMELEFSRCLPFLWSKPTLKMPVLNLMSCTEPFIRNLVIYEHSAKVQMCITSYMKAMDMLIDTPEDVTRLVKSNVLVNRLGSDEKAANLINNVLEKVPIKKFFYKDELDNMDKYYNACWPNFIAESKRKYFTSPWSITALLAGIFLFGFTLIQTLYAAKAIPELN